MAPILSFTAEEVLASLPEALRDARIATVFALPPLEEDALRERGHMLDDAARAMWERVIAVRGAVTRAIEPLRQAGTVGHSLDTSVTLYADAALKAELASVGTDLRALCIVSKLTLDDMAQAPAEAADTDVEGLKIAVSRAQGEKCERCWIYSTQLGTDPAHPTLCPRCAAVLRG